MVISVNFKGCSYISNRSSHTEASLGKDRTCLTLCEYNSWWRQWTLPRYSKHSHNAHVHTMQCTNHLKSIITALLYYHWVKTPAVASALISKMQCIFKSRSCSKSV